MRRPGLRGVMRGKVVKTTVSGSKPLTRCHFIEDGDIVIVLGPTDAGKTHLAVSLGMKAIESGYRCGSPPRRALTSSGSRR